MKIALLGYGRMGQAIEQIALDRGHEIVAKIDQDNRILLESDEFKSADVVIEFTIPSEAVKNYFYCFEHKLPVVSGTTGWLDDYQLVKTACEQEGNTFFYASNFSLGVNIFFALNKKLAQMMQAFPNYKLSMQEVHHTKKLDEPSGTAITIANDLLGVFEEKETWGLANESSQDFDIPITCKREGDVPGIHSVKYDSAEDELEIRHSAHNRQGFALGAVLAAEFTMHNKGLLTMEQMLKLQ